ncbi:hypothetical protein OfM2_05130 [Lactovum odontotermitis]
MSLGFKSVTHVVEFKTLTIDKALSDLTLFPIDSAQYSESSHQVDKFRFTEIARRQMR